MQLKLQYEQTLPSFLNLEYALKTVDDQDAPTAFAKHFGAEMWDFYKEHPEHQINFSMAMKAQDALGGPPTSLCAQFVSQGHLSELLLSSHAHIADIAGLIRKVRGWRASKFRR